ncbi:MAG TPA: AraC family transcriptional regulator [Polyangiaceae bacterium]
MRPTLAELESIADLGQWRLCVVFKRTYGVTIGQYWNALRLAEAVRCLQSGLSIKMIVSTLGYVDEPYFSRVFKAHYGVAPGAWLKLYRANDRLIRARRSRSPRAP